MRQTVEAVIDEQGHVYLTEPATVQGLHRALLTILDELPSASVEESAWLSRKRLAECGPGSGNDENESIGCHNAGGFAALRGIATVKTLVQEQSAKRLAALGGQMPEMQEIPRRHEGIE